VITWSFPCWGLTTAWESLQGSFLHRTLELFAEPGKPKTDATESGDSGARTSRSWQES